MIQKRLHYFDNKIEDLENRSRCSRLKNYSYYRGKIKRKMIGFITTLIITVMGMCFPTQMGNDINTWIHVLPL